MILALETGINGGSLCLFDNNRIIDYWTGEGKVSKADDILEQINEIFVKNNIQKSAVNKIVYSKGPGSFTGLRIGAALAKGLGKALGCKIAAASLLDSMLKSANDSQNNSLGEGVVVTAVSFGKTQVCWQSFDSRFDKNKDAAVKSDKVIAAQFDLFINYLKNLQVDKLILDDSLYRKIFTPENEETEISNQNRLKPLTVNAGKNLAGYLAVNINEVIQTESFADSDLIYPSEYN